MVFNAFFNKYFSYIMAVSFTGGGNPEYQEKTTDLLQVTDTDKLYHTLPEQDANSQRLATNQS